MVPLNLQCREGRDHASKSYALVLKVGKHKTNRQDEIAPLSQKIYQLSGLTVKTSRAADDTFTEQFVHLGICI